MVKRTVYLRKNLEHEIRWHSWPNPKVSVQVQTDGVHLFQSARYTLHKGFRDFYRHFKFLQPLEFDF